MPLVPRERVQEVRGRIGSDGAEIEKLDEQGLLDAAKALAATGVEIAVVAFIHSYRNPAHERLARDLVERHGVDLRMELSSDIWPQAREYERAVLTTINASIRPIVEAYVRRLTDGLSESGLATPARIARSNGGAELARTMRDRPVAALLSGPAAGVAGAAAAAEDAGWEAADLMTLDVGGTSADIGVIRDGQPVLSSEELVGDFPCSSPPWRCRASAPVAARSSGSTPPGLEGRPHQCRRRSWSGLLRQRIIDPGTDRRVSARGSADPRPTARWQAGAATGARAAGPGRSRAAFAADRGAGRGRRDPGRDRHDGGGGHARAGAARGRCAALPDGGIRRCRTADGRAHRRGDHYRHHSRSTLSGRAQCARRARADIAGDLVRPVYARLHTLSAAALTEAYGALQCEAEKWIADQSAGADTGPFRATYTAEMRYEGQGYDVPVATRAGLAREW